MRSSLLTSTAVCAAAVALLAGCSMAPQVTAKPTPTVTAQSVKDACDGLEADVTALQEDINEAGSLLASDLPAGSELMTQIAADFEVAANKVENEEVLAVATDASAEITAFSDLMVAAAADPLTADSDAIIASGESIQAAFEAIGEVCD